MSRSNSKFSANIWKKMSFIGNFQGALRVDDLSTQLGMSEHEALIFLKELFPGGVGANVYEKNNELWVDLDAKSLEYMLPLSPSEWMCLKEVVISGDIQASDLKIHQSLKKKILENGPLQTIMNLLCRLENRGEQLNDVHRNYVKIAEEALETKKILELSINEEKTYSVYPSRILHLEGQLSLICEGVFDHSLSVFTFNALKGLKILEGCSKSRLTHFEIEEFISALRSMGDKETRLILKIYNPQSVNLFPQYHFLGKPCMVTNPNGDLIWAAYVEACEPLYEWLLSLGSAVEILDPNMFKTDFLRYCEEKLKKMA